MDRFGRSKRRDKYDDDEDNRVEPGLKTEEMERQRKMYVATDLVWETFYRFNPFGPSPNRVKKCCSSRVESRGNQKPVTVLGAKKYPQKVYDFLFFRYSSNYIYFCLTEDER